MNLSSSFLGSRLTCTFAKESRVLSTPKQPVTMAKKKGIRCIVTLECTEARAEGATPSRYTTEKNRKNTAGRLELKKYNRYLRRHTLHKEIK